MATNYTVKPNQSMKDVVMECLGSMEAGMQFCRDNGVGINDIPVVGTVYIVSDAAIVKAGSAGAGVVAKYAANKTVVGTLGNGAVCGRMPNLRVSLITNAGATISWDDTPNAAIYAYQVTTSSVAPTTFGGTSVGSSTAVLLNTLEPDTSYWFYGYVVCSDGSHSGRWDSVGFMTVTSPLTDTDGTPLTDTDGTPLGDTD